MIFVYWITGFIIGGIVFFGGFLVGQGYGILCERERRAGAEARAAQLLKKSLDNTIPMPKFE